jgi:hypothetical protein
VGGQLLLHELGGDGVDTGDGALYEDVEGELVDPARRAAAGVEELPDGAVGEEASWAAAWRSWKRMWFRVSSRWNGWSAWTKPRRVLKGSRAGSRSVRRRASVPVIRTLKRSSAWSA